MLLAYVANTQSMVATFADRDVSWGVRHVYGGQAISAAGRSERSNYVNVTPQDRGRLPATRKAAHLDVLPVRNAKGLPTAPDAVGISTQPALERPGRKRWSLGLAPGC